MFMLVLEYGCVLCLRRATHAWCMFILHFTVAYGGRRPSSRIPNRLLVRLRLRLLAICSLFAFENQIEIVMLNFCFSLKWNK